MHLELLLRRYTAANGIVDIPDHRALTTLDVMEQHEQRLAHYEALLTFLRAGYCQIKCRGSPRLCESGIMCYMSEFGDI